MKSLKEQLGGLVYSTDSGNMCPGCAAPIKECCCQQISEQQRLSTLDGIVRIHRETKGRKGKGVTLIKGVSLGDKELKLLAKAMKQHCGTGGAVKAGVIEIQGDQRQVLKVFLEKRQYKVKLAGG
ncbi:MAG: translation initiation factor Sui1 [Oceanospirillaceae bacterium]|nr:translation initiation factor Sui1 [Oceanospirillaceae bacterium]